MGQVIDMSIDTSSLNFNALLKTYFDIQLKNIGLTEKQIGEQSISELYESLERVNEALINPESFGEVNIGYGATSPYIAKSGSKYHSKIGIASILIERKKLILDRIKELTTNEKLESLHDLINGIKDNELKNKLSIQLESLQKEAKEYSEESKKIATKEAEEKLRLEQEIAKQKLELFKEKSKIWQSYLKKESVATIVGGLILIAFTITLIAAMFFKIESTEIINNGFLVILGYFFGQQAVKTEKEDK